MHPLNQAWQAVAGEFESAQRKAANVARFRISEELNQLARRLKQYSTETDWYDAVLDGASQFSPQTAVFSAANESLTGQGSRGFNLPPAVSIPFDDAAAFRNARDSGDMVMALRLKDEVSEALAGSASGDRCYILPISNGPRISALLFAAAGSETDLNALELIVTVASAVLERRAQHPSQIQIAARSGDSPVAPKTSGELAFAKEPAGVEPAWHTLADSEKLLHVRAKRFGRSRVAEMQLYRPEACQSGREQRDLYLFLKAEIDGARDTFRNQFMTVQSMEDYLHLELVGQLANNDDSLLGEDYPGQMV